MIDDDPGPRMRALEQRAALARRAERAPAPPIVVSKRPTHTITERPWDDGSSLSAVVRWTPRCAHALPECGGVCDLAPNHIGAHECAGDEPGRPGSCPA